MDLDDTCVIGGVNYSAVAVRVLDHAMRAYWLIAMAACSPPTPDKSTTPTSVAPPPHTAAAPKPTPGFEWGLPQPSGPPLARTVDVVDKQFGIDAPDPYRWMEGGENAEYTAWLRGEGELAAKQLAAIPGRDKLHARL